MPQPYGQEPFNSYAPQQNGYYDQPQWVDGFNYAPNQQLPVIKEKPKTASLVSTIIILIVSCIVATISINILINTLLAPAEEAEIATTHVLVKDGNTVSNTTQPSTDPLTAIVTSKEKEPEANQVVEIKDVPVTTDYSSYVKGTQFLPAPYYRSMFDARHQLVYDQILDAMHDMRTNVVIETIPGADVASVYEAILNDNPDVFWVSLEYSFSQDQYDQAHEVIINYAMDPETRANYQSAIDAYTNNIVNTASVLPTNYDKLKFFYDTICDTCEYDINAPNNQNMAGCMVDHRAACAGYARALQYMCYRCGISCAYLTGTGDDGTGPVSHAWNAVEIDGIVTYIDVTWGDQASASIPDDYAYLCLTKDDMIRTGHVFAHPEWAPEAIDPRYEYWVMHNGYFDNYDYASVLSRCIAGIANGENTTYLRFATPEMFETAYNDFVLTPTGANDIVTVFPDMSMQVTGKAPYAAYRVDPINVLVFVWRSDIPVEP